MSSFGARKAKKTEATGRQVISWSCFSSSKGREKVGSPVNKGYNRDDRKGSMGFDRSRFKQSDLKEQYFCPICSDVFKDPVQREKCEHYFCKKCITQWLKTSRSCPIDREPLALKRLKDIPRVLTSLLADLDIKCDFAAVGCQAMVKLEQLDVHEKECAFRFEAVIECVKNCGATFKWKDKKSHCCVAYLQALNKVLEEEAKEKERKLMNESKALKEEQKKCQQIMNNLRKRVKELEEEAEGEGVPPPGQGSAKRRSLRLMNQ